MLLAIKIIPITADEITRIFFIHFTGGHIDFPKDSRANDFKQWSPYFLSSGNGGRNGMRKEGGDEEEGILSG